LLLLFDFLDFGFSSSSLASLFLFFSFNCSTIEIGLATGALAFLGSGLLLTGAAGAFYKKNTHTHINLLVPEP
jgi:hypothetical protein